MEFSSPHDDLLNSTAAEFIAQQMDNAEAVTADTDMPPELRVILIKKLRDETGMDLKASADTVREYLYRNPHWEYDVWSTSRYEEIQTLRDAQRAQNRRRQWWRFWDR